MNFPGMQPSYKLMTGCTLFYSIHYQELLNVKKNHIRDLYIGSAIMNPSLISSSIVMSKDFHIEIQC